MKIIVQKYGGTSVNSVYMRNKIAENLQKNLIKGYQCVIVVSAMGRKGEPYATDTLLQLIPPTMAHTRELDMLLSCGEIISSVIVSTHLKRSGFNSIPVTGGQCGILTNNDHGNAKILNIQKENILKILKANQIPVVTGFQGINEIGDITTLGRGGSDVSAVELGIALNAEHVEIFTDVDGIMTADPKIVPHAKLIPKIPYDDVFQLAEYGAKVIHPRAVEIAMRYGMPLKIYNTQNFSENAGTLIYNDVQGKDNLVAAIAHDDGQVQCRLENYRSTKNIFNEIAKMQISIDMINVFKEHCLFIIKREKKKDLVKILEKNEMEYSLLDNCTKITVIGSSIRGVPGVMAKIISALEDNINILQTSDSHTTISLLVCSVLAEKAINHIHTIFQL